MLNSQPEAYESPIFKNLVKQCTWHVAETCSSGSEEQALHRPNVLALCLLDSMDSCLLEHGAAAPLKTTPTNPRTSQLVKGASIVLIPPIKPAPVIDPIPIPPRRPIGPIGPIGPPIIIPPRPTRPTRPIGPIGPIGPPIIIPPIEPETVTDDGPIIIPPIEPKPIDPKPIPVPPHRTQTHRPQTHTRTPPHRTQTHNHTTHTTQTHRTPYYCIISRNCY
ncbi:hypothetical protein AAZX31_15G243600 [Glycine max]|uniref:Uncharacterized protein n=1 Tax=Glycine max TaxID=3847 RepID=K7ME06_SOYBN|nr:hypothetical protein GYH30_043504 [Glycine max]KRH13738.1 hypothetical protein GLYMA_15G260900v4 [Glycine max]